MAYAGAMRNGSTPRLVGMVSKVDEKTLCTESATMHLAGMFTIHADSSHDPPLAAASNQLIAYIHLCVPTLCGDFTGWM